MKFTYYYNSDLKEAAENNTILIQRQWEKKKNIHIFIISKAYF